MHTPEVRFETLGVSHEILKSLRAMSFEIATPVQARAIPLFMEGKDAVVQAPTGTGKTAAFGIPILQHLDRQLTLPQVLILSPTRELTLQTTDVLKSLSRHIPGVRIAAIYGGQNIDRQFALLRNRPQIVVATPGRLIDHMDRGTVKLEGLRVAVLDEADRMLDMGFRNDIKHILGATPKERQTVIFSATFTREVLSIAAAYQKKDVARVMVEKDTDKPDAITQYYTQVPSAGKYEALFCLLKEKEFPLSLVFVNTKHRADRLAQQLKKRGLRAGALHGNLNQNQRDRVMGAYRNGDINILVATDVAARGIDVYNISAVINYDMPNDDDGYIHRIGRTGRADKGGASYTFLLPEELPRLLKLARARHMQILSTGPLPERVRLAAEQAQEQAHTRVQEQAHTRVQEHRPPAQSKKAAAGHGRPQQPAQKPRQSAKGKPSASKPSPSKPPAGKPSDKRRYASKRRPNDRLAQ